MAYGMPGGLPRGGMIPRAPFQPRRNPGEARKSSQTVDEKELMTKMIKETLFDGSIPISPSLRRIFIGALNPGMTEEQLFATFGKYGKIEACNMPKIWGTRMNRGFGFVTFDTVKSVEAAVFDSPNHHIGTKWVDVKRAVSMDQMKVLIDGHNTTLKELQAINA
jgi:RNA recognition motif-containing protein